MNAATNARGFQKAPRNGDAPSRGAVEPNTVRPRFPSTEAIMRAVDAIPKLILWKIASYEILRRLSPGEASKVQVVVANYWESYEILQAMRDIETLLLIGPQRLVQGHLRGTQWDEGMRKFRMKLQEFRQTLGAIAKEWQIVLASVERSPVAPRVPAPHRPEEGGSPPRGAPLERATAPKAETTAAA